MALIGGRFLTPSFSLKKKYGDSDLKVQAIEKKSGGEFIIRLEVPQDADKALIEQRAKELYADQLNTLENQYKDQLKVQGSHLEDALKTIESERYDKARLVSILATLAENQGSSYFANQIFIESSVQQAAVKMGDKFEINESTFGVFNTGKIGEIDSIKINVNALRKANESSFADAIESMTEAIARNKEISEDNRAQLLTYFEELSRQGLLPPEKRSSAKFPKEHVCKHFYRNWCSWWTSRNMVNMGEKKYQLF